MSLLRVPQSVVELASRLEGARFEVWCVGGAVRDALLGHPHLDWDLATSATPEEVQRLFRRTVPLGIKFGTVGVLDRDGRMHEVTTFRRDVETDGRHAVVTFGASLEEDLARRDLTINAIAYSPSRDELRDPFGGRADLERRLIRAVGTPAERMREDRLRALRAIRFAARLGFEIEPTTWEAIVEAAPHLGRLSPERVRQEIEKTMEQVERPSAAFAQWKDSGALRTLIPGLADADPVLLRALDHLPLPGMPGRPQRRINRVTTLFLGLNSSRLRSTLKDLRFSNQDSDWILGVAGHWQRLGATIEAALVGDAPLRPVTVRRWVAETGRMQLAPLIRIAAAVWAARREAGLEAPEPNGIHAAYRILLRTAYRDPVTLADLAVDGADLIETGIPAGARLGKILRMLLDLVLEDPSLNRRDTLLRKAHELNARLIEPGEDR